MDRFKRWQRKTAPAILAGTFALGTLTCHNVHAQTPSIGNILQTFRTPPTESRPMVRWWWFGTAVERPEILRELQQMKADGIGGAELAFVYPEAIDDPGRHLKNLPFLSPDMLAAVTYAQAEGRKLGLRIDITMGSGWPYGGPATTLAEAAGRLRILEVSVPPNATSVAYPKLHPGDTEISLSIVKGEPTHWDPTSAQPVFYNVAGVCCPVLTVGVNAAPVARTLLFFIASHTGQQVKRAAVGAEGFVLDPFSHQAVATHLRTVGEPLVKAFGATPPYAIFSDSLEAYGADWTPSLPEEFRKRRGYDLIPHLPELVAGGSPTAEKIRHDYGRTLTELVNENYLTQINDWAIAHHTRFRSQTYGEPAVSFSSQRLAALPEGEGPQWRTFSTLRWATSANHVFGNAVTSGETFTWLHSPVFRATPLDMKAEADIDFIMGENQLIFHGWPYSPPASELPPGDPGWSLYAAAVFNDHNPWHPVMPAVTDYIARISYLLRQGQPANQVAILLPTDDAWASFSPGKVTITGAMTKLVPPQLMAAILSAGYNVDFIDADAINTVGLARYQVLVIPPTDRIPVETLTRIDEWAKPSGLKERNYAICLSRCPSIDPEGKPLPKMSSSFVLASTPTALPDTLHKAATPDLQLRAEDASSLDQVGFIRRTLPDADIYFVVNTGNQAIDVLATFTTSHTRGVILNPEDAVSSTPTSAVGQSIHLAPYESRIFLFSETQAIPLRPSPTASLRNLQDLSSDWLLRFTNTGKTVAEPTRADWTANPTTLHYSGEAVYTRDFTLPSRHTGSVYLQVDGGTALPGSPNSTPAAPRLGTNGLPDPLVTKPGPGMHAYFDPPLHEAALVFVNGEAAGALWHPPYRLDVSTLLRSGRNNIEIRVYNTALNAWSALTPRDYKPLIAQYGDRFQMQDLDKVKPVVSGLLGPVHLVQEAAQ